MATDYFDEAVKGARAAAARSQSLHLEGLARSGKRALAAHVGEWHTVNGYRTRNETPGRERWTQDELLNVHAEMHPDHGTGRG